jgi:RNA polymerase sigma-70 factor (ECF subfamily)
MPAASLGEGLGPRWALRRGEEGERALVRGAQAGSRGDLEALFEMHWRRAHRAAFLIVHDAAAAEDIAQEAFISALRALDRFDRTRPFGPWLHRIVVNRAIDHARARALRREVAEMAAHAVGSSHTGPDVSSELVSVLADLPAEQRAVVVLRHLLGYTPGEIGSLLGLPRGTVNSRLRRGLDHLAQRFGDEGWAE